MKKSGTGVRGIAQALSQAKQLKNLSLDSAQVQADLAAKQQMQLALGSQIEAAEVSVAASEARLASLQRLSTEREVELRRLVERLSLLDDRRDWASSLLRGLVEA